jgi:hypothetical protein
MWQRLRQFSVLERPARRLFLSAFVLLPLISLSLRARGFRKTQSFLQRFISSRGASQQASVPAQTALTARMARSAAHHTLGRATCLAESLALWWLLGRQGIASELKVGVRKESGKFEAHAWVQRDGAALNEPEAKHQHYAAFDAALASLPPELR